MTDCSYIKPINGALIIINFEPITNTLPFLINFTRTNCTAIMSITVYYYLNSNTVKVYQHKSSIGLDNQSLFGHIDTHKSQLFYDEIVDQLYNKLRLDNDFCTTECNIGGKNVLRISPQFKSSAIFMAPSLVLTLLDDHCMSPFDHAMILYLEVGIVSGQVNSNTVLSLNTALQFNNNAILNSDGWYNHIAASERDLRVKHLHDAWSARNALMQLQIKNLQAKLLESTYLPDETSEDLEHILTNEDNHELSMSATNNSSPDSNTNGENQFDNVDNVDDAETNEDHTC
jgi:hypothetical protein